MKIAKRICQTSRPVVALGKQFFYRQIQMSRDDAYRLLPLYTSTFLFVGFILILVEWNLPVSVVDLVRKTSVNRTCK